MQTERNDAPLQPSTPAQTPGAHRQGVERELLAAATEALISKTEELQQQRELFKVTLASIGDGVITTDARGLVTYLNHQRGYDGGGPQSDQHGIGKRTNRQTAPAQRAARQARRSNPHRR